MLSRSSLAVGDPSYCAEGLHHQIYPGDEAFVFSMQVKAELVRAKFGQIPAAQRSKPVKLEDGLAYCPRQGEALLIAHTKSAGISMTAIAAELGLSAGV